MNTPLHRPYWLHALEPVHVGAGRGTDFIDLPIMREKVTGFPVVPGSTVKGVSAEAAGVTDQSREDGIHRAAFGWVGVSGDVGSESLANSGALQFTDARLVCFPVQSLFGTFAWCTSPFVLQRLLRDLQTADADPGLEDVFDIKDESNLLVPEAQQDTDFKSVLCDNHSRAYFADLDLAASVSHTAADWAATVADLVFVDNDRWKTLFRERFAIVHDNVLAFLAETATQVDARVKIDSQTKTVSSGQLWYEESLPPETILGGLVWCGRLFHTPDDYKDKKSPQKELLDDFCKESMTLQVGGKATVGRGRVRTTFTVSQEA